MQNRYYVIGAPIEDRKNFLMWESPKEYTQKQLITSSLHKETTVKLFEHRDQAELCANALRRDAGDEYYFALKAKSRTHVSRVRPIFTVELSPSEAKEFGKVCSQITSDPRSYKQPLVEMTHYFHEINSSLIQEKHIKKVEFPKTQMPAVEFEEKPTRKQRISL